HTLLDSLCGGSADTVQGDEKKWFTSNKLLTVYNPCPDLIASLQPNNDLEHTYQNREHEYPMTDHGLFIAGIVHSLAPNAHIHLIRVLNDYGVGTIETLARGLDAVLPEIAVDPSTRIIMNCSLTINLLKDKDGNIVLPGSEGQADILTKLKD